jgi:hypothetical protein
MRIGLAGNPTSPGPAEADCATPFGWICATVTPGATMSAKQTIKLSIRAIHMFCPYRATQALIVKR